MNPKISIISVNWWALDFAKVLYNSVVKNSSVDFEIIFVDNSNNLDWEKDFCSDTRVIIIHPKENMGHGAGLNTGIEMARGEYILILDIDAHILLNGWGKKLIEQFEKNEDLKLATATDGGLLKPARPLAMFFKRETIIDNGIDFKAVELRGIKFDVGVAAYFRILTLFGDKSVLKLPAQKTEFKDVLGNEYALNGESFVYHNWYGTRWYNKEGKRVHQKIDRISWNDFKIKKDNLFNQL